MSRIARGLALGALSVALFAYLTAEVFTAGALLAMQAEFGVPPGEIGALVSTYAIVAALAIPPVAWLTRRVAARRLLPAALAVLAVSQLVVATAPGLAVIQWARGAAALGHGALWAGAPVVAAAILPRTPGRATAIVFLGSSIGGVAGAPMVALVSQLASWRVAAAGLAVLAALCAGALAYLLPSGVGTPHARQRVARRGSVRRVALWCGLVIAVATAHLASFSYVADTALRRGLAAGWVAPLLLGLGVAGIVGNLLIGRVNDRAPLRSTLLALVVLTIGFGLTFGPLPLFVIGGIAWSAAYAGLTVAFQAFVTRDAPGWERQASSWYVLAFQIGIAAGATLGGLAVPGLDPAIQRSAISAGAALAALVVAAIALAGRARKIGEAPTGPPA